MAKGHENLIPANKRSKDEVRKNGRKGGKASGKARKQAKTFKTLAQQLLTMKPTNSIRINEKKVYPLIEKIKELFPGLKESDMTNRTALLFTLMREALKGDKQAIDMMMNTAGEKEPEKLVATVINFNKKDVKKYADALRKKL